MAPVNRLVLEAALAGDFNDFEDAVIHEAACHVGADAIVTRNRKDFRKARIMVCTPEEIAKILTVKSDMPGGNNSSLNHSRFNKRAQIVYNSVQSFEQAEE